MKKAHLIGICGVGMSATAMLLRDAGYEVTGTTGVCYPPILDFLEVHNLATSVDYARGNIPEGVELIVAGASAALDPTKNEEVAEAYARNIQVKTFPEILNDLSVGKKTIVVAGSYAKTTCTALIAWILHYAGIDPSYFIGALVPQLKVHGHLGSGEVFVIEGDEYPTSGMDERPKFLLFPTHTVLFTSADHDHVNKFKTPEEYRAAFRGLLARIPSDGLLVACIDNSEVRKLLQEYTGPHTTYGVQTGTTASWRAKNISFGAKTTFDLIHNGTHIVSITTQLLGLHNVENIVGACALILERGLVSAQEIAEAVQAFEGITRRLDQKTNTKSVLVYEGFGSSYAKARAAIEAMKTHFPSRRCIVVFEPHTFSWRNRDMLHWYDDVFRDVAHTLIYPPPDIGVANHEQVNHEEILGRAGKHSQVHKITSEEDGLRVLKDLLEKDDVVLLLTSGNLGGLIQSVPHLVQEHFA